MNSFYDYVPGSATAEYQRMVDEAAEIAERFTPGPYNGHLAVFHKLPDVVLGHFGAGVLGLDFSHDFRGRPHTRDSSLPI